MTRPLALRDRIERVAVRWLAAADTDERRARVAAVLAHLELAR